MRWHVVGQGADGTTWGLYVLADSASDAVASARARFLYVGISLQSPRARRVAEDVVAPYPAHEQKEARR
jgi:ketopantoate reductase